MGAVPTPEAVAFAAAFTAAPTVPICQTPGCKRRANHGPRRQKTHVMCGRHGKPLNYVRRFTRHGVRKCQHEGCSITATFGPPGGKREFCAEHGRVRGMKCLVVARHRSVVCQEDGCSTIASYGVEGTSKRLYCAPHGAKRGMVNVKRSFACSAADCSAPATCGTRGSKKRSRCAAHMTDGMERIHMAQQCLEDGCLKRAVCGAGTEAHYCPSHGKARNLSPVASKLCEVDGCTKFAVARPLDTMTRTRCRIHTKNTTIPMLLYEGVRKVSYCDVEGCFIRPSYCPRNGLTKLRCARHGKEVQWKHMNVWGRAALQHQAKRARLRERPVQQHRSAFDVLMRASNPAT